MPRSDDAADTLVALLRRNGPARGTDAREQLGLTQPTFSRIVARNPERILAFGRGRATRYAARRAIDGVDAPIPVYEVGPEGEAPRVFARLHPVAPSGHVAAGNADVDGALFGDLPWFLQDLRPAGFLGRREGRRHRELGAPADVRLWDDVHVARWLVRYGANLPGAFVVGNESWQRWLEQVANPQDLVDVAHRERRYPELAAAVLDEKDPGSSAGGEQPKFLATRREGDRFVPVIVKFSPVIDGADAQRTADLLVAEHLAHDVLRQHGHDACVSRLATGGGRLFLEVERFDRQGIAGRRGVVSLQTVDLHHVATDLSSWARSTRALLQSRIVDADTHLRVLWLEAFGRLIANTDMHAANLSFLLRGARLNGLAPVYDMMPFRYAVTAGGHRTDEPFTAPVPGPEDGPVWEQAVAAAAGLWGAVADDRRVSERFREVAAENARRVADRRRLQALLPRPAPG